LSRYHGGAFGHLLSLGESAVIGITDSFSVKKERFLPESGLIIAGSARSAGDGKAFLVQPFLGFGEDIIYLDGVGLGCGCKGKDEGKCGKQGFHG